jgi:hypothetical protein
MFRGGSVGSVPIRQSGEVFSGSLSCSPRNASFPVLTHEIDLHGR